MLPLFKATFLRIHNCRSALRDSQAHVVALASFALRMSEYAWARFFEEPSPDDILAVAPTLRQFGNSNVLFTHERRDAPHCVERNCVGGLCRHYWSKSSVGKEEPVFCGERITMRDRMRRRRSASETRIEAANLRTARPLVDKGEVRNLETPAIHLSVLAELQGLHNTPRRISVKQNRHTDPETGLPGLIAAPVAFWISEGRLHHRNGRASV